MYSLTGKSRFYLLITFALGAVSGLLDSNDFNPWFLIGSGIGFSIIAILIGVTIHSILLLFNFYKKRPKDLSLLDENLDESEKEVWRRKNEIREKPYLYTLYISILLFILMNVG